MTISESAKHRIRREENLLIESKLHPHISIDGVLIIHRHVGKNIIFQAWANGTPLNNRECHVKRDAVLFAVDFYSENKDELGWLVGRDFPKKGEPK